ncbi:Aldo/keto reductase [Cubamyces sp. BRFM 1775]|nr:Aldo/keto reductase [Cubamyces sp. BRFM 1775]
MAQSTQKTKLNIVMGAAGFGAPGKEGTRVHELKDVEAILDLFQSHGHFEVDTARMYTEGTSEEYLGKIFPTVDLRRILDVSLKALNADFIEMWYLHGPDRTTPYDVTMKAVNELYKEGKFKRFGISNFAAWEVAEIVGICKANDYIQPSVYQGVYNAIHRKVEPELFPCLRKFGIAFYAFNPLGGGLFTGRYHSANDQVEPGSRFDPSKNMGKLYRARYWQEPYFRALEQIDAIAQKHGLTMAEIALRWLEHHSLLSREHGDAIIIGASSIKHVEQNLDDLEKGPLPEEVLKVLDEAWLSVSPHATKYFH